MRLILTVGLPRSGKSTWAKEQGHPIVNPDSIRLALHGERFAFPAEPMVWAIAEYMVRALFLAGHETVILDACNNTEKRRKVWEKVAGRLEAEVVYYHINESAEVCIARAEAEGDEEIIPVIERMEKERGDDARQN